MRTRFAKINRANILTCGLHSVNTTPVAFCKPYIVVSINHDTFQEKGTEGEFFPAAGILQLPDSSI